MAVSMIKSFIIFLLFISSFSGLADDSSFKDGMKLTYPHAEVNLERKVRKLIGFGARLDDYQVPEANPSHDPHKGTPIGGKGGNNS